MSDATRDDDIPTADTKEQAVRALRGTDDEPGGTVRYNGAVVPAWPDGRPTWDEARQWVAEHAPARRQGRPSTGQGRKVSVYLDDDAVETIEREQARSGRSASEIVRDAIAMLRDANAGGD